MECLFCVILTVCGVFFCVILTVCGVFFCVILTVCGVFFLCNFDCLWSVFFV